MIQTQEMKKHIRILLTGLFIVIPFAITLWVVWGICVWLDNIGRTPLSWISDKFSPGSWMHQWGFRGVGIVLVIALVYVVGLLMHFLLFRWAVKSVERMFTHLPGIKTIYVSVKDLLKLFGSSSRKVGRVVEYKPPGMGIAMLGILTNESPQVPPGQDGAQRVAVFFPMAYMIGGSVALVERKYLRELDMPVETAMKLSATAHLSMDSSESADLLAAGKEKQN
jgi:uncharacterized membrane protein